MLILMERYALSVPLVCVVPDTARLQAARPSAKPKAISRRRFWIKARSSGLLRNPTSIKIEGKKVSRQKATRPMPVAVSGFAPRLGSEGTRRVRASSSNSA